jgi:(5-formylfuran-3-yl)methyl phosphate synthase
MIALPLFGRETPGLLVSVRSAEEALEAVRGGASVIDVKEPDRGPLGRATPATWRAVKAVVPPSIPVSVALGELADWTAGPVDYEGISFRKLGLADAGIDWRARWAEVRRLEPGQTRWVAVAYADWRLAGSPDPFAVLEAAIGADDCSGILIDTWDKTKPTPLAPTVEWGDWVAQARQGGRFVALAGGLDRAEIARLSPLRPDLFAVRGAACQNRDRSGLVRADQVAGLVRAIRESRR